MGRFDEFLGGERDPTYDAPEVPAAPDATTTPSGRNHVAPAPPPPPATVAAPQGRFDDFTGGTPTRAPLGPNDVDWSAYNQPFGTVQAADQNTTEAAKSKAQNAILAIGSALGGQPDPYMARNVADAAVTLGSYTPLGAPLAAGDAAQSFATGHPIRGSIEALGAIPAVSAARRVYQFAKGTLPTLRMADTPTRVIEKYVDPQTGLTKARVNDELLNQSRSNYGKVAQADLDYHPNVGTHFAKTAQNDLANVPDAYGRVIPREVAPGVYGLLERRGQELAARGTPITPNDLDILRQQLRAFGQGPEGAAGARAAALLDQYMYNPPAGAITRMGAPGVMDFVRANLEAARGDYRAGKTAATVEQEIDRRALKTAKANSALNLDNTTRAGLEQLIDPKFVKSRLPGATYDEQQAIRKVVEGDATTNRLRYWSNRLGGGGGLGGTLLGGAGGYGLGHMLSAWGVDPISAGAIGGALGFVQPKIGEALRVAGNERTVKAAQDVVDEIRRNSPLYKTREAVSPPIPDPFAL